MSSIFTRRPSQALPPTLAAALADFERFQPPAKPPQLVAAEADLAAAKAARKAAGEAVKAASAEFRRQQQQGWSGDAQMIREAEEAEKAAEAEVSRLKLLVDHVGEAWRLDYAAALRESARPIRAALRTETEAALQAVEAGYRALDRAAFAASNNRVGSNWILRNAAELAQRIALVRRIVEADNDLARQEF